MHDLKNVRDAHGGVLLLAACNLLLKVTCSLLLNLKVKVTLPRWIFSFLDCTNGTKLRNAPHIPSRNVPTKSILLKKKPDKFCYKILPQKLDTLF